MSSELHSLLERIDQILHAYDPGLPLDPDMVVHEVFKRRAGQNHLLEEAICLASEGLKRFSENPELIRRRAFARFRVVTADGEFPLVEQAEADLRHLLELDPNNLMAGVSLLEELFTFSGLADAEVGELSDDMAKRAEKLLLSARSLQIRALAYAGQHEQSAEVYAHWHSLFPDSELLADAKADADSMTPTREQ